ncbi:TetR family transcriptional regulator [Streptomyces albidoflavus]
MAARAGLTRSTFHRHFSDKRDILSVRHPGPPAGQSSWRARVRRGSAAERAARTS